MLKPSIFFRKAQILEWLTNTSKPTGAVITSSLNLSRSSFSYNDLPPFATEKQIYLDLWPLAPTTQPENPFSLSSPRQPWVWPKAFLSRKLFPDFPHYCHLYHSPFLKHILPLQLLSQPIHIVMCIVIPQYPQGIACRTPEETKAVNIQVPQTLYFHITKVHQHIL